MYMTNGTSKTTASIQAFFFNIKNTSTLKQEQVLKPTKIQELFSHVYASFTCTPHKQSLYSLSELIIKVNTTFTTLHIQF
jgi:hypothetical protein